MIVSIFLIVLGFVLLIKGADFLVDGASNLAKKFHIPEIIIGLTIVSIGTSMPELFVSVTSSINGHSDMAMGNAIGSNVCNLLLILGLSAVIKPVVFQKQTKIIEIPMSVLLTIIFMIICNTNGKISRVESCILIVLFIIFILYTIYMAKKEKTEEREESKNISSIRSIVNIIIGVLALKFGGSFAVDNAVIVAKHLNISEQIISLTILAVGTSLPELVTSVRAAIKGNSDIAIGNIIGSNIFNMLLIIGVASIINPITYNYLYNLDITVLLVAMFALAIFSIVPPKNEMNRINGIIYLIMYVIYVLIMFNK